MKIDISETTDQEIQILVQKFKEAGFIQEDEQYVYHDVKTPLGKTQLGIAMYPELLFYGDKIVPWICGKVELEGGKNDEINIRLCKVILKVLDNLNLKPFMDEDAHLQHFSVDEKIGWTNFKFYLNPDYPNGELGNHTL